MTEKTGDTVKLDVVEMSEKPRDATPDQKTLSPDSAPKKTPTEGATQDTKNSDLVKLDPSGEYALGDLRHFYQKLFQVDVHADLEIVVEQSGETHSYHTDIHFTAEKPNRFAIRRKGTTFGPDVVNNGTVQVIYSPATNIYSETLAPEHYELRLNPGFSPLQPQFYDEFLLGLVSLSPSQYLFRGYEACQNLGIEDLNGEKCWHIRATRPESTLDVWMLTGNAPWVRKISKDLPQVARAKNFQKYQQSLTFKEWNREISDAENSFAFVLPKGAMKNHSRYPFFKDQEMGREEPSPLLGEPAPEVKLPLLGGGEFNLASEHDKHIVMLDFWATWCGPCVREMPVLAKVAQDYADKGVVLYCLNQQEEKETIEKFLQEEKLNVTVALDAESAAGDAYGVSGIPMLVLIDKKGIVQSVHVGFSPDLETTLKQELDAILEGKDLAAEKLAARQSQMDVAELRPEGLEEVWSKRGRYTGLATTPDGKIYANQGGDVKVFRVDGEETESVELAESGRTIRLARRSAAPNSYQLISFDHWGQSVSATSLDGELLWSVKQGQGVDDVAAADLDGDGSDEIIVGYNGGTGLHVFDSAGKPKWNDTSIGNVWTVTAGDVNGDGVLEVVTTSAAGKVHQFGPDGTVISATSPIMYSHTVRVGKLENEEKATIFVIGTGEKAPAVAAANEKGVSYWSVTLPETSRHCSAASVHEKTGLLAASFVDGNVYVINAKTGKIRGTLSGQTRTAEVAWASSRGESEPLLLIANGSSLAAYRIVEESGAEPDSETAGQK